MMFDEYFGPAIFYDKNGNELEVTANSWFSDGEYITQEFYTEGEFPKKGKIIFVVYEEIKHHEIPFKLNNISLLGEPIE